MKKIAIFLATSGHSGVDRLMTNLINEFGQRNVSVDLLQIKNHGPYLKQLPDNLTLIDLGTSHVNTSLIPLIKYLKKAKPDVLLSDKDKVNRTALWAKKLSGVSTRVVVRMGTTVSINLAARKPLQRRLQYASIRYFYPWAHEIIMPSVGAAKDLAKIAKVPTSRVTVIPNPVINEKLFDLSNEPCEHPWINKKTLPVILGVGELGSRKDFSTLIQAFSILHQSIPSRLIILGEGKQREMLTDLAENLGLSDHIDLPGYCQNPYTYMAKADVFTLTSICEGASVVIVEALGLGTPVVSTDCPSGPKEILKNGTLGHLVPIKQPESLAKAILDTLNNPISSETLKEAANAYTTTKIADLYLNALGIKNG